MHIRNLALSLMVGACLFVSAHSASAAAIAMTPHNVEVIQARLESLGYFTDGESGVMGPATRDAIANFQRDNGIYANGDLNVPTYQVLMGVVYAPYIQYPYYSYATPAGYYVGNSNVTYYQSVATPVAGYAAVATPIAGKRVWANGTYYSYPVAAYPGVTQPLYMYRNLP
jgi:peptidoglycan hydrolase-like protein with peptidoglycan-binding domain